MELIFADRNYDVAESLKSVFKDFPEIQVFNDDLLVIAENSIVSPANSYGLMDGGIDLAYINHFGTGLQKKVLERIDPLGGRLNVGSAVTVHIGKGKIKYLIVAPTMELPGEVHPINCYRAMRAILREIEKNKDLHKKVFCPGLATGTGRVSAPNAAKEMYNAYVDWKNSRNKH